jgi:hypothetical protein
VRYVEQGQVMRLSPRELRRLLRDGDPQERVWSAWALAMALGSAFVSELRSAYANESDIGVRRHWLVVLAGYGCRELVADATRTDAPQPVIERLIGLLFDPDPDVRETMRHRIERGDFDRGPAEAALEILARVAAAPTTRTDPEDRTCALVRYRPPLHPT